MQRAVLLLLSIAYCLVSTAQRRWEVVRKTSTYTLKQTEYFYRLGHNNIGIVVYHYNKNPGIILISPHDDENTAIEVSKQALRKLGGTLIKINNHGERLITFKINNVSYQFDPNRIFTHKGIAASLKLYGNYSKAAVLKIAKFAKFIVDKIPPDTRNVIALHNNHKGKYSIDTYENNGHLVTDSRAVYTDSSRAKDDFFITTSEVIYNKLRGYRYNVILQDNDLAKDDGSLSIYFGKKNRSYVNVEAGHGKSDEQLKMLMVALNPPKRKIKNSILYNFEIADSAIFKNAGNLKIFFGDKQIGTLLSITYSAARKMTFGQLETDQKFPLYSNCDFFLHGKAETPSLEVRIDPTREKKPLDRLRETISVSVRK